MKTSQHPFQQTIVLILFFAIAITACNGPSNSKLSSAGVVAPDTFRGLLSVKDMQADLLILWNGIQEIHPAYGLYTTKDSLLQLYKQTAASLNKPMSEDEFIAAVYPFVSALKCGHTQIKHSENYKPASAYRMPHLPFEVLVENGAEYRRRIVEYEQYARVGNNKTWRRFVRHGWQQ